MTETPDPGKKPPPLYLLMQGDELYRYEELRAEGALLPRETIAHLDYDGAFKMLQGLAQVARIPDLSIKEYKPL